MVCCETSCLVAGTLTFGASKRIQQSIVDQLYFIRKTMRTLDGGGRASDTKCNDAEDNVQAIIAERLRKISQVIDIAESAQLDPWYN